MPRYRGNRVGREPIEREQPSATIYLTPVKPQKPWCSYLTWDLLLIVCVILSAVGYTILYFHLNPTLEKMAPLQGPEFDNKVWGTYRPHTYFGLKTRSSMSPMFGIMWYEQPDTVQRPVIRHWCHQDDDLVKYAWYEADGRSFGRQNITEKTGTIQTDWVADGHGFASRVKFNMQPGKRYNLIVYLTSLDNNNRFRRGKHLSDIIHMHSEFFGKQQLAINMKKSTRLSQIHSILLTDERIPADRFHDFIVDNMQLLDGDMHDKISFLLNDHHNDKEGRFIAVQLNFGHEAEFDITLTPSDVKPTIFEKFDAELKKRSDAFNRKFENVFAISSKNYTASQRQMGKVALSNMLGSIGYWFGFNRVMVGNNYQMYGPHVLFSAVPSRPFFPRGFLWDEGFHNMLIRKFDPKLSLEIISSWMNVMEQSGWIPREMILGMEAEAKVPEEFIAQRPDVANPPSLFYVVDKLVHDEKVVSKYSHVLARIYPRLEKWFVWLRTTQYGPTRSTFRWRGRNATILTELNPKTLSSGLDDYPRASHPSNEEYHLDLRCWLALCARVMERLSKFYGTDSDHRRFSKQMEELNDFEQLVRDHWSDKEQGFFDYGKHSYDVALAPVPTPGQPRRFEYQRVTSRAPTNKLVTDAFGYNSLFPMMLRLIPPRSKALKATLEKLRDPKILWTEFGLRSISKSSPYYQARNTEHDPPYWRGYIWININYMVLSSLQYYSKEQGPFAELAGRIFYELRQNLVNNMGKQFEKTGYIWENYDDRTGEGRGSHPFNGWSSLILMIMSDNLDT